MFTWFLHFENLFMICAFSTCKILKGKENEYGSITSSSLNPSSTHCPLKIQYNPHQCILVRSPPSSLSKRRIIFSQAFQTKHSHLLFLPNAKMFPSLRYLHVLFLLSDILSYMIVTYLLPTQILHSEKCHF